MSYLSWKVGQVQSITKFMQDPCAAPWTVYFELALKPAGHVVIELLMFGMDDVVRGFFRPKGIWRKSRNSRILGKFAKWLGIPEIGELIGSHLPGATTIKSRKVSNGIKNLWIIDGVLQRVMFWWMVVDLVTDFLYEWTSAIAKTEFCQRGPLTGSFSCPVRTGDGFTSLGWSTISIDLPRCEKAWGDIFQIGGGYMYGRVGYTAASVHVAELIPPLTAVSMRVIDINSLIVIPPTLIEQRDPTTWEGLLSGTIPGMTQTFVQIRSGSGVGVITAGDMTGFGY